MLSTVLIDLEVKPGSADRLTAYLREILPDTRAYEGCGGSVAYQDAADPKRLVLVEEWTSREHFETYLAWRQETGVLDRLVSMLTGSPRVRHLERADR